MGSDRLAYHAKPKWSAWLGTTLRPGGLHNQSGDDQRHGLECRKIGLGSRTRSPCGDVANHSVSKPGVHIRIWGARFVRYGLQGDTLTRNTNFDILEILTMLPTISDNMSIKFLRNLRPVEYKQK